MTTMLSENHFLFFLGRPVIRWRQWPAQRNTLPGEAHDGTGCLILDVHLDGKSGPELQNELLMMDSHLPIIFITGQGKYPHERGCIEEGSG